MIRLQLQRRPQMGSRPLRIAQRNEISEAFTEWVGNEAQLAPVKR